jgi:ferritin-like metal-binding protein YciE
MFNHSIFPGPFSTWMLAGGFVLTMALSGFDSPMDRIGIIPTVEASEETRKLFKIQLSEMLAMEQKMTEEMGGLLQQAGRAELRETIEQLRKGSAAHADRLLRIFEQEDLSPRDLESPAYDAIVASNRNTLSQLREPDVRDAAIIAGCMRGIHFQKAAYMNLLQTAGMVRGMEEAVSALQESLSETNMWEMQLDRLAQTQMDAANTPDGMDPSVEPRQIPQR